MKILRLTKKEKVAMRNGKKKKILTEFIEYEFDDWMIRLIFLLGPDVRVIGIHEVNSVPYNGTVCAIRFGP